MRLALGAGRARIVRQLLVEGLLLALVGGLAGLIISPWAIRLLIGIMPETDPPLRFSTDPNLRLVFFTMAVSVVTAVIFGLLPALQAARPAIARVLKDQAGAVVGGGQARWRKMLVVAQVSLSLLLLIGAGLFGRSLHNLRSLNPGFEVSNLLSFQVDPTLNGYNPERAKLFYRQLTDSLQHASWRRRGSHVRGAAAHFRRMGQLDRRGRLRRQTGRGHESAREPHLTRIFRHAEDSALPRAGILRSQDALGAPKVAIVNEKFAQHYFGGRGAAGAAYRDGRRPRHEDRYRDRRRGARHQVQPHERGAAAPGLLPVPAARLGRADDRLRAHAAAARADVPDDPRRGAQAGCEPAGLPDEDGGKAAGRFAGRGAPLG